VIVIDEYLAVRVLGGAALPGGDLGVIRQPQPEVLQILDPRPLLDDAAAIAVPTSGLS
jgi:hypothetical protein